MFSTKHSVATLYFAGPIYANDIAANLRKRGVTGATIMAGLGFWKDEKPEPVFAVTIIGETATPAHLAYGPIGGSDAPALMPGNPTGFADRIRDLAENLALDYGQEAVAFTIAPCLFELTTAQAIYRRNG